MPNAGKSTLFNALITKPKASVGKHPFTTIDKNIGVVDVPNKTLFELAKIENIAKVTPTTVTFIDIAGLIKGAHSGEGLGNQFLHHIREVDLIFHLVRFFRDETVPHVHQQVDPEEDIEIVNEELMLADLQMLENRLQKEKITPEEKEVTKKIILELNRGLPASQIPFNDKEKEVVKQFNLLTLKKQLVVANIDEEDINKPPKEIKGKTVLSISAKLESELSELPWVEQQQFLKDYQIKKTAKENIILAAYQALDIVTFYTIAKRTEARAWTIKKGSTALVASGKIHTDFVKNFIKAEVINVQELIKIGSWQQAHHLGKIILHGKEYIVQDQDVLEIKAGVK